MQINNATNASLPIQNIGHSTLPNVPVNVEPDRQQQQSSQSQRVNRVEVDENAIKLLEREGSPTQQPTYDNPSEQNNTAISTYQAVGNLEQRESVQQLLGVDIYA